jgi:hypothetical protein
MSDQCKHGWDLEECPGCSDLPKRTELSSQLKNLHTLRPLSEYHEDYGCVLWHHYPIQEPPYVGSGPGMGETTRQGKPTTCRRLIESGWLTHWSPIPQNPEIA